MKFFINSAKIWKKLIAKIKSFSGLSLVDEKIDGGYVTPDESAGEDEVFISRMRVKNDFNIGLWVVADNLRKGAALNSIQIGEALIKKFLKWRKILKVDISKITTLTKLSIIVFQEQLLVVMFHYI